MPSIYQDLADDEAAQRADPQRYWAAERECLLAITGNEGESTIYDVIERFQILL
jgi:hypothetical protein